MEIRIRCYVCPHSKIFSDFPLKNVWLSDYSFWQSLQRCEQILGNCILFTTLNVFFLNLWLCNLFEASQGKSLLRPQLSAVCLKLIKFKCIIFSDCFICFISSGKGALSMSRLLIWKIRSKSQSSNNRLRGKFQQCQSSMKFSAVGKLRL